jgi:hypothetical protein
MVLIGVTEERALQKRPFNLKMATAMFARGSSPKAEGVQTKYITTARPMDLKHQKMCGL